MWRLNLHKSNAANERLADGLSNGRTSPWSDTSSQILFILTALAIKIHPLSGWYFLCGQSPMILAASKDAYTICHLRGECYLLPVNGS